MMSDLGMTTIMDNSEGMDSPSMKLLNKRPKIGCDHLSSLGEPFVSVQRPKPIFHFNLHADDFTGYSSLAVTR